MLKQPENQAFKDSLASFLQETNRLEVFYKTVSEDFKKLRLRLESSLAILNAIVEHLPEGLLFINLSGTIELFNSSAEKALQCNLRASSNLKYADYFFDDFFGFSMQLALQAHTSISHKAFITAQRQEIELSSSIIPGKGVLILLRDLTDQRKLEKALIRNDRLRELGEMAAALAHEIRNPLGGIQGFASLLEKDLNESSNEKRMVSAILEGTKALNRLVTNVLQYARPLEMHLSPCDAAELVEQTIALLTADPCSKIQNNFKITKESCLIYADRDLIKMALLNLFQNALHTSQGKAIFIDVKKQGNQVLIAIQDQGEGIAEENLEKIFLPFFTTKPSGTGLGLSEAQKIAHAHEGTIEVSSKVGMGSTFTLKVPSYASSGKNSYCG